VLQQNNQLPAMFADVRRGLTIAAVVHGATVKDTDGNEVDTDEFFGPPTSAEGAEESDTEDVEDSDAEGADDDDK
jgi:trigger factor